MKIIPRGFYKRNTVDVAKAILGNILVRVIDGNLLSGIIVESEAYRSIDDPASHSHNGKTERNGVMFGEVGLAYVYITYGIHYCLNVVAKEDTFPAGAVLIRAIEPIMGIEHMRKFRKIDDLYNLTNGPGKLTNALNVNKKHNGTDITRKGNMYILEGVPINRSSIKATPRIGIRLAADKQWRFLITGNKFVSGNVKTYS